MSGFRERYVSPAAVLMHARRVRATILHQLALVEAGGPLPNHLLLLSPVEAERVVRHDLEEHESEATLAFVASVEGLLRHDLRNNRRPKGELKRKFQALIKAADDAGRRGVRLDDLLDLWKIETEQPGPFGQFQDVVTYRNWLAHGRYFLMPQAAERWDLAQVVALTVRMLEAIVARPDLKIESYHSVLDELQAVV